MGGRGVSYGVLRKPLHVIRESKQAKDCHNKCTNMTGVGRKNVKISVGMYIFVLQSRSFIM